MTAVNPKARHGARRSSLHALYQQHITKKPILDIAAEILADPHTSMLDVDYFREITQGAVERLEILDELIAPVTDRPLNEISPIELSILRVAVYELKFCLQTPYRVIINEAIEIAKKFGAEDSHKYVNGVLDKILPTTRKAEWQNSKS